MVAKTGTITIKHADPDTAGRVPAPDKLQYAELAINTADRKLYSKDVAGNVFQVGGEPGNVPGKLVQWQSFVGSQNQGILVNPDNPVWFRRNKDKVTEFTSVWITRDIDPDADRTNNILGYTSSCLRLEVTVKQLAQETSQWPFVSVVKYETPTGDAGNAQHVALFGGIVKKNPSAFMWASNIGVRDYSINPTRGSVGMELTLAVAGADNNGQRFGLHVACNSIDPNGVLPDSQPGTNGIFAAIVAGGPAANVQFNRLVKLEGTGKVAIDMSEVTFESGDVALRMVSGAKLQWGDAFSMTSAPKGQLAWFPSIQTFGIDGMKTQFTAGALVAYKVIQFDGTELCIPVYAKS